MQTKTVADDILEAELQEHRPMALGLIRRYGIPRQDADDLLQDVCLAFVERFDEIENHQAWLHVTLRNRCRLYWRARRRRVYDCIDRSLLDLLAEESSGRPVAEVRHDLGRVLARVSRTCRAVLELRYLHGDSGASAARKTGYQESGIYKVIQRCLAALAMELCSPPERGRE